MKNEKGFTLIEVLAVVLIIGILAAVGLPYYARVVERSRLSEVEQVLGNVVRDQRLMKVKRNTYAESWRALNSPPPAAPQGPLYCTRGDNRPDQEACPNEKTIFEMRLCGKDAPDAQAATVATRLNSKEYGEYHLYRYYEETPAQVYCWADTDNAKKLCMDFLDSDTYQAPARALPCNLHATNPDDPTLPPTKPDDDKTIIKTEGCSGGYENRPDVCRVDYFADGTKQETMYITGGNASYVGTFDKDGNKTSETWYNQDGSINRKDAYDSGGNKTAETRYNPDGSVSSYTKYSPSGGWETVTQYNSDGSIKFHQCYSGPCTQPGYTPPPASGFGKPGSLCQQYPDEKQCL